MSYQVFFNLDDAPFRLTPDPAYFFPSKRHNEALETLLYSVESGEGFVQITGEPGVGKTLLIRSFLDQLGEDVNTALILHPHLTAAELFKVILEDLGLAPKNMEVMTKESLLRSFREILLQSAREGKKTLIIIDEAQEIPEETLEELRLLSNLETEEKKLLQIILVGQRELEDKLNQDRLRQLKQRITIRYCLDCLSYDETVNYIQHRLKIAGSGNISRFSPQIIKKIHKLSNGIPRIINSLCERALMAAFVDGKSTVNRKHLHSALQSLQGETTGSPIVRLFRTRPLIAYSAVVIFSVCTALYLTNAPFKQFLQQQGGRTLTLIHAVKEKISAKFVVDNNRNVEVTHSLSQERQQSGNNGQDNHQGWIPTAITQNTGKGNRVQQKTLSPAIRDQHITASSTSSNEVLISKKIAGQLKHFSPETVLSLPSGWEGIVILRHSNTAILLQGRGHTAQIINTLALPTATTLEKGLYLVGKQKDTPYLFNHRSFFAWHVDKSLAKWLWQQFGKNSNISLVPVIVTEAKLLPTAKENLSAIQTMVKNWAESFNRQDLNNFMLYYDDSILTYRIFRNRPQVQSHSEITTDKKNVFKKNKTLFLQISEPACLINPNDSSRGMAIFYQRFISSKYADSGVKVFYLRKTGAIPGKPKWVITGRLWLAAKDNVQQIMTAQ